MYVNWHELTLEAQYQTAKRIQRAEEWRLARQCATDTVQPSPLQRLFARLKNDGQNQNTFITPVLVSTNER
jgi:hypothetical protein